MCDSLGNILTSIVPNLHFGKRPGPGDMTIFGSHVGPHIPNIEYLKALEVYGNIWTYTKASESIYEGI